MRARFVRLPAPLRVALVVLALHAAWIAAFFAAGHEIRDFIRLGPYFVNMSAESDVIALDLEYEYPQNRDDKREGLGFDGQFYYFIAADPAEAHHYIDDPPYRYSRILYPMASRVLGGGDPDAIPYAMLALNWLALGLGAAAMAAWFKRKGFTPWLGLLFGLYPGFAIALQRDLTEIFGYSLLACAIYLFDFGGKRGLYLAAGVFALAALSRETTALFALLYLGSILLGRPNATLGEDASRSERWRSAIVFGAISLIPIVAWTIFLWIWLGPAETGANDLGPPFIGLFTADWELERQPVMIASCAIPALLASALSIFAWKEGRGRLEMACVLSNTLFVIVLAAEIIWVSSYTTMGRASAGIFLATLLLIPYVWDRGPTMRRGLVVAVALWMAMLPAVAIYGFTDFQV
jgi:hypothetical protein